jgi:hypothetical protein
MIIMTGNAAACDLIMLKEGNENDFNCIAWNEMA